MSNESAFPIATNDYVIAGGMSLRDYFAAKAMNDYVIAGGMSLRDYFAAKAMTIMWDAYDKGYCGFDSQDQMSADDIAHASYQLADAMLKARGE